MRLDQYLESKNIRPCVFAAQIGLAPSIITRFLKGERGLSLESAWLINKASRGMVRYEDMVLGGSDTSPPGASQV